MPVLTANFSSTVSSSIREDLSDVITTIDPTECPITANIGRVDVDNPEGYEWQTDSLASASDAGVTDGFAFSSLGDSVTTRARLLARCQIQAKGFTISKRLEQTDKAGLDSEVSYQIAMRSEELKRDAEAAITSLRSPVASASGTAPLVAGIPSWLATNTERSAGGNDPTIASGEPVAVTATVDGTATRALDESLILGVLGGIYDNGGNADMISVGRAAKQAMSSFFFSGSARIATQYQDHGKSPASGLQVVGAVDYYVSDFGVLAIVPNRFQRARDCFILDTSLWEMGEFRGFEVQEIAPDGDRYNYQIVHDFTLVSRNEAGSGIFADVDGTAAMVA